MPLVLAFVAGGLSTLNPCGFAVLPVLLSYYVSAEPEEHRRTPARMTYGLTVGTTVTAGFMTMFTLIGVPLLLGGGALVKVTPWGGIVVGIALTVVGIGDLLGRDFGGLKSRWVPRRERTLRSMYLFGAAYGLASFGCTLPVFLALIGSSLSTNGLAPAFVVFGAYAAGVALVLISLTIGAALVRQGLEAKLKKAIPHVHRISPVLLVVAGAYLTYYWARALSGPATSLANDPVAGFVVRITSRFESALLSPFGWILAGVAAATVVTLLGAAALRMRHGGSNPVTDGGSLKP